MSNAEELAKRHEAMKDIELPPLPDADVYTSTALIGYRYSYSAILMQAYARAAVEADRAQRVPDGYREVLSNLLWAATERDAKNRIRQFDEFLDAARSMLASTPAQPAQQEPQRKLSAVDLAKAAAKEKFRHYREVMVNAHQEPPQPVERKPINCWCEACDLAQGNQLGRTRMSLCPECGDKRCPRAKHHDAPCNGIKE